MHEEMIYEKIFNVIKTNIPEPSEKLEEATQHFKKMNRKEKKKFLLTFIDKIQDKDILKLIKRIGE